MPSLRGSAIREFVRYYAAHYDAGWIGPMLSTHPLHDRSGLDVKAPVYGIRVNEWYDAALAHTLCDEIYRRHGETGAAQIAHLGAKAAVDAQVTGVYRGVLRQLVSPKLYAMSIPKLWGLLHDTGTRQVRLDPDGTSATSIISDWPGHHPFLCLSAHELMAAVFELMGMRDVHVLPLSCVSRGSARCVARVTYRAP